MKIKKTNNPVNFRNILPEQIFEDKSKRLDLNHGSSGNQRSPCNEEVNLENVPNLDAINIEENFQFVNFNKLDLESLDIINQNVIAKEELFYDLIQIDTDRNNSSYENNAMSPDALHVSSSSYISENMPNSVKIGEVPSENKRAAKRRQRLEQSKVQCSVRTTARHYTKMLEYFEANPGLATGQLPKMIYRKRWRELTELLNKQGIGEKTTEKWQKTWSDYKLHLRKKISGIKRSGKALDVPNQFTDLDKRALSNMGVSFCDENSKIAIKKRFNPDTLNNEDSSTAQSTNLPTSTTDCTKKSTRPLRHTKLIYRRRHNYYSKTLKELLQLRITVSKGLNRIGDILERLVKTSNNNNAIAVSLAEAAGQITMTATDLAQVLRNKHANIGY